jgi:MoaA/NifB/PqqE/SkfB family radical SAM enzyme
MGGELLMKHRRIWKTHVVKHHVLCNYYVTYRCNAKCSFCDIWEKPSPYINLKNVEENLKDLKKLGVSVIDFTGGEPLLHRELDEILRLAKSFGFITTITTNTLLYPKYAKKLKGLVDMLHFSLDSPDEAEHNESRKVKCFDKFLESIEIAKELGEKPDILFTVFPDNIHKIKEVYEKFCLPNNFMLILNPVFEYNSVGDNLSQQDLITLLEWGKKKWVYINKAFLTLRMDGGNQIDNPICRAGSSTVVISPENKLVLPCYHLGLKEIPINGNLFELYKTAEVKELIAQEGKHPKCQGCVINCYMNPSFAVEVSPYWFEAVSSTLRYSYRKKMFGKYLVNRLGL